MVWWWCWRCRHTTPAGSPSASTSADHGAAPGSPEAGGPNPGQPADSAIAALTQELEQAKAQATENLDLYVRARADVENIRRRAAEDVSKAHKYALEGFAESLVPVMDSLELALKVDNPSVQSLREGVEATLRQLTSAFDKNRLLIIDPVGEKFDPNRHQAISTVPVAATQPPVAANHVVTVLQKGYLINDRVFAPGIGDGGPGLNSVS